MGDVKPFGHRIAVIDPPAHEEHHHGLIIPATIAMERLAAGIVTSTEQSELDEITAMFKSIGFTAVTTGLKIGALVYYVEGAGWRIGDTRIINLSDIVAFEELD